MCGTLADLLEAEGFAVVCALDDRAAYAALRREASAFSVLFVDINLGLGTTGFDVARYARTLAPKVPVVFISGMEDERSVSRFGVAGAIFLKKPFGAAELSEALALAIRPARPPQGAG